MNALAWFWLAVVEFVESTFKLIETVVTGIWKIGEFIVCGVFFLFAWLIGVALMFAFAGAIALVIFAVLKASWLTVFGGSS